MDSSYKQTCAQSFSDAKTIFIFFIFIKNYVLDQGGYEESTLTFFKVYLFKKKFIQQSEPYLDML